MLLPLLFLCYSLWVSEAKIFPQDKGTRSSLRFLILIDATTSESSGPHRNSLPGPSLKIAQRSPNTPLHLFMAAQMNKEEDMEYAMMKKKKKEGGGDGEEEENDMTAKDYYFDSYSHFGIHEEMLKDTVRTRSYERAISRCAHLIRGKTVLDVGCGTGILSLFCARAGAKRVFGVECSAIAKTAQEVVKENGMEDIVRIVRGKVEEVELPFDEGEEPYVDVIVSEWMGYFLVYEAMLKSVAIARERWLREGGLVMPGSARLLLCGIEDGEYRKEKIDYWDNVYGFKMTCIRKLAIQEPLVDTVAAEQVCTTSSVVCRLDIGKIESEKTAEPFSAPFRLLGTRSDIVHAFVGCVRDPHTTTCPP